jgi:hypothetical protein
LTGKALIHFFGHLYISVTTPTLFLPSGFTAHSVIVRQYCYCQTQQHAPVLVAVEQEITSISTSVASERLKQQRALGPAANPFLNSTAAPRGIIP